MTFPFTKRSFVPAGLIGATLLVLSACATPPAPPQPASTPTASASVPTAMPACPGATDGPSIAVSAVEESRRVLAANPSLVPPVCVVGAFARINGYLPDTLIEHASALAADIARRGAPSRELLAAQVLLLGRAHRYADVLPVYDRLAAVDSHPAFDVIRTALGAAHQQHDTARLTRILARATTMPEASAAMRGELNVLRQASALHSATTEARGLIRQNPKYVAAYPSLVGNFGTLGASDSVAAYVRRGLAQGGNARRATAGARSLCQCHAS